MSVKEDEPKIIFVQFPVEDVRKFSKIVEWFKINAPRGYKFYIGSNYKVLNKQDIEVMIKELHDLIKAE